jgi:23S rRNA (adenine2503-C2)-methyltransferase
VRDWGELTDIPAALRADLPTRFRLQALEVATEQRSVDGTVKLLLRTWDGQAIEAVQIPASTGPRTGEGVSREKTTRGSRLTVCVSSQAGCALACEFCATGQMGFTRNLSVGEIVEQVYGAEVPGTARRVDNVVFMGMGEPMANYANVVGAIRLLADPQGYGFSPRRVTVSTSGLVPQMRRLTEEGLDVRLAVSLHAPDDELRSRLMPINRRYPIADVIAAAANYAEHVGRRVSYEYVMLDGVNDGENRALQLTRLLRDQHAHVNLIPYNQTFSGFRRSPTPRIRAFAQILQASHIPCTIRASRGQDIAAACGQLRATTDGSKAPGTTATAESTT